MNIHIHNHICICICIVIITINNSNIRIHINIITSVDIHINKIRMILLKKSRIGGNFDVGGRLQEGDGELGMIPDSEMQS